MFPLDVEDYLSHDDLQALVAGLAGVALDDGNAAGVPIAGIPPMRLMARGARASSSIRRARRLADVRRQSLVSSFI
jgi:hypothetical protein